MTTADLINKALSFLDNRLTKLGDRIEKSLDKANKPDFSALEKITAAQAVQLMKAVKALESKVLTFEGTIQTDNADIVDAISKLKLEQKDSPLLNDIKTIIYALQKDISIKGTEKLEAKLDTLIETFKNFKLEVPDTIKLDASQLKALKMSSGGGGMAAPMKGKNIVLANVAMADANTEYSYTFPSFVTGFYMKVRSVDAQFGYAWATGKLPTSGDGSAYMTTTYNFLQSRPDVEVSNETIYFQSDTAGQVMEIEVYTA
jgi:hypothetical protein